MKTTILAILLTLSIVVKSQNSETYLAWSLTESVYQALEQKGVTRLKQIGTDSCDCGITLEGNLVLFVKKEEVIDSIILDKDISDEDVEYIVGEYIKSINKLGQPHFSEVWVETTIKQKSNRFSLLRWKRKVKYNLVVDIRWNP